MYATYICLRSISQRRMKMGNVSFYLHLIVTSFLLFTLLPEAINATKKVYIVYLGAHSHGPTPTSLDLEAATYSHYDLLASVLQSHEKAKEAIIYSYNKHINGFAALLEDEEAAVIAKNPTVVTVFETKKFKLQTTRSWEFLGLHRYSKNSAWQKGRYGENTIIANIDTGVWPESRSFSDRGYGPVPSKWRGGNVCQINRLNGSTKVPCNRKLIGARYFNKAYEAYYGKVGDASKHTARDYQGHGTHTLSTAGGNFVPGASVYAVGNGTAKGGSPRARVAAYKVCWGLIDPTDCYGADIIDAFDHAINDGVDIISMSVGSQPATYPEQILTDEISLGAFHAISRNILVVAAAGNDGATPGTVVNVAPWIFTVGASTIDRQFRTILTFNNNRRVIGASLNINLPSNQAFSVVLSVAAKLANVSTQAALFCRPGTLDPAKVKGKIVACKRENKIKSVTEGLEAQTAGAKAVMVENQKKNGRTLFSENHVFSGMDNPNGAVYGGSNVQVKAPSKPPGHPPPSKPPGHPPPAEYYDESAISLPITVKVSAAQTVFGIRPAPVVASFSSRGPNLILPSILKPDVTAPGVDILASYSPAATASTLPQDPRRGFQFNVQQGTSMSCPHVAGIAGLLKTLHPNWSPAAIKSAIMTTATTRDNTNRAIRDGFDLSAANPFAYGSGHVQPDLAIDPGLVYDLGPTDYLKFLCAEGYNQQLISAMNFHGSFSCPKNTTFESILDLNYPSITLPNLGLKAVTVTRRVTNVGPPGTYVVASAQLEGHSVTVVPNSLSFTKTGQVKTFRVTVKASSVIVPGKYHFGELLWTDGKHRVRSPITVHR